MRRLAASIMFDHSQVLFELRGVECGERAFDAKQVEAWQKAQKTPRSHGLRGAKSFDQWWLSPDFINLFGSVARFQNIPVDDAPHCGEMIDTAVLIVEVVGMFPYVDAEKWASIRGERGCLHWVLA